MCGILAVKGVGIAQEQHMAAVELLKQRGPDAVRYHSSESIFVAHTVLHITGSDHYYQTAPDRDFFAYNGEIYNYQKFGNYSIDTELVHEAVLTNHNWFKKMEGPWAWARTSYGNLSYAADPQGERCLYHYQDNDILIVSSEVAVILSYIDPQFDPIEYSNKCWTMIEKTPWQGITRCQPGMMYQNGIAVKSLDSMWDWIHPIQCSTQDAAEEFNSIWQQVCADQVTSCPAAVSFSGGVDSSLILDTIPDLKPVSINIIGKDPVVTHVPEFLDYKQLQQLIMLDIDTEVWAAEYIALIKRTRMPAQTWSYVGKWLVAKHCCSRVIFTGLAADELFGGYSVYSQLQYSSAGSTSPYSQFDHDNLWDRCMNSYNGNAKQATLLMDYWYQVVGVDAPGLDRLGGAWGRETRNPFMNQRLIKFALNLPDTLKENKSLVKKQFLRHRFQEQIYPKVGFAGHANDSFQNSTTTGNRQQDWKLIAQESFYANAI